MKKAEFIELVRRYMSGGNLNDDLEQRYGEGVISKLIELAYNEMVFISYKQALSINDYSPLDMYVKTYKADVIYDNNRKYYYSKIPVSIISLPQNSGIRRITNTNDNNTELIHIARNYTSGFSKLEASKITDNIFYSIETDKIIYTNIDPVIKKLLLHLIVPFSNFEDDENISFPSENALYMFNIIQDLLKKELPEKLTIDNTSKQI